MVTIVVLEQFFRMKLGLRNFDYTPERELGEKPGRYSLTLFAVVDGLENSAYSEMIKEFVDPLPADDVDAELRLDDVAKCIFRDAGFSWPRICLLVTIAAAYCDRFVDADRDAGVYRVAAWLKRYFTNTIEPWIHDHGDWESLFNYFKSRLAHGQVEIVDGMEQMLRQRAVADEQRTDINERYTKQKERFYAHNIRNINTNAAPLSPNGLQRGVATRHDTHMAPQPDAKTGLNNPNFLVAGIASLVVVGAAAAMKK